MKEKKIDVQSLLEDGRESNHPPVIESLNFFGRDQVTFVDRGWYMVMEFELSSSGKFAQAVEIAKQNPHFTELVDERGVSIYRTIYFKDQFPRFHDLFEIVGGWKNTRFYFKGTEIKPIELETWYTSFRAYWGHRRSLNITDYCGQSKINPYPDFIGCYDRNIYLRWRDPLMTHYHQGSRMWYSFGKRSGNEFLIDKTAMHHYLKSLNPDFHPCPAYGHHIVDQVIHKLPNSLKPAEGKQWLFKEDYLRASERHAMMFHHEIALSVLPDICPVSEKNYHKFLDAIFRAGV